MLRFDLKLLLVLHQTSDDTGKPVSHKRTIKYHPPTPLQPTLKI
jgi:hypothetical protein